MNNNKWWNPFAWIKDKINQRKMRITFAAIDLGFTDQERELMLDEVLSAPDQAWHYNEFRGCSMLPLYNADGQMGGQAKGKNTRDGEFMWTEAATYMAYTNALIKERVFPWMIPEGRITILRTPVGFGLNVHLDSTQEEIGTLQHKFRIVLNGDIDKLYFIDAQGEKQYVPQDYHTYVLDGSHPHALDPGTEEKITLCIGAPWTGEPNPLYSRLIEHSAYTMKISRPKQLKPSWTDPFWKK